MYYWEFCMRAQSKHVFCRDNTQAIEWLFIMRVAYDISIISNCGKLLKVMSRLHSSAMWGRLHPLPTAMYVVCATNHHKFYDKVVILGHLSCVTRAPLLYFIRSWVALSFKVCQSQSVRHPWHLSRSPLCAIYKGINALYWPSIINYQLLPPYTISYSVLYWPCTQLHHLVTHSWANWI